MNIISKITKQSKAVAIVEYTVLAGLIGTLAVSSVVKLGTQVADNNNQTSTIINDKIASASATGAVALTLADVRSAPYVPPARVSGRVYEDFVVVSKQDPATEQWIFSLGLASTYNPGEVVDVLPSGFISGPFDGGATAYGLCVLASQATGQIADPAKSMFPAVFGGSSTDITIDKFTFDIDASDYGNTLDVPYYDDPSLSAPTSIVPWISVSKPLNSVLAFTCSRPQ